MSDSTQATPSTQDEIFDLLVVGAGPTGLSCAIEAQKAGLRAVVVDKGCVCNSLFHYPAHMTFFTTPELLEIGGIPFPAPIPSPAATRRSSITGTWRPTTGWTCVCTIAWSG